jgi:predicted dehydrogenase
VNKPLRIGIIGMGGFAGSHHTAVAKLEEKGHSRLICTCDPMAASFEALKDSLRFKERGVAVFDDYIEMLDACAANLDFVILPTPINLHAQMHDAVTSRGIACYIEKPPTLDYAELERMITADKRSSKASVVGFNFIIEKPRLALKRRILDGEFGSIIRTALSAQWPRPSSYFSRNTWAGRLLIDDKILLDSCFGNAMAHFVHNMLFWAGSSDLFSWAKIASVKAELYRAHKIEGADTFFIEATTTSGASMRYALTHACAGQSSHLETVVCEKAELRYVVGSHIEIRWNDGRTERIALDQFDGLAENHLDYYRYFRGEADRPATTLTDCRPFVALNDLAYISSREITAIPQAFISGIRDEKEQKDYLNVNGMVPTIEQFLSKRIWPSSAGWNRSPSENIPLTELNQLDRIVRAMASATHETKA